MEQLGRHLVIELWGCNGRINNAEQVAQAIREAVDAAGATLLNLDVHTFSPQGVTGLALLSESHLSVHSWPEHNYLAADVFTCGDTTDPLAAAGVLRRHFDPETVELQELARGVHPDSHEDAPRVRRTRWRRSRAESLTPAEAVLN